MLAKFSAAALCAVLGAVALPAAAASDWSQVEQVLGRSSTQQPDGVHRFSFPRTDLNVSVDAIQIEVGRDLRRDANFIATLVEGVAVFYRTYLKD